MKGEVAAPSRMGQRGLEISPGLPGDERSGYVLRSPQRCPLEARKPLDDDSSMGGLDEVDWGRFKRCLIASRCVFGLCPVEHVPPDECPHESCPHGCCPPSVCPW
jgi:hypothetical protein